MRLFALALAFVSFGGVAQASGEVPVVASLESVLTLFAPDFEAQVGRPHQKEIYGLKSSLVGDEVEVKAFFQPVAGQLQSLVYDCHEDHHADHDEDHVHGAEKAEAAYDCHLADLTPAVSFAFNAGNFELADYGLALEESLALFERRVAPTSSLQALEIWQQGDTLQLVLTYDKAGQSASTNMMCHWHTPGAFDCHRQIRPGAGRP